VYLNNFGTTVFLFRKDAQEYWKITEAEVFAKALALYRKALALAPTDFKMATDYAQTFYGVHPTGSPSPQARAESERKIRGEAMEAWRHAATLSDDDEELAGVRLHLVRWQIKGGDFTGARSNLVTVTNAIHADTRRRLERSLADHEASAKAGQPPPPVPGAEVPPAQKSPTPLPAPTPAKP
jgi:tetratricopeptide (TPR) repeat protein